MAEPERVITNMDCYQGFDAELQDIQYVSLTKKIIVARSQHPNHGYVWALFLVDGIYYDEVFSYRTSSPNKAVEDAYLCSPKGLL